MTPAQRVAAVLGGAALATPLIASWEGLGLQGYRDPAPAGYETICYGHMEKGVLGKTYSPDKCAELLAQDAVKHGLDIAPCLPEDVPASFRAAHTSIAFNIGASAFCKSSMSRKALAGDLKGSCAALSLYVYSGGVKLKGLERRRAAERELCERDL